MFSQVDEPIGFLPDLVTMGDSTPALNFRLSVERFPLKLKSKKDRLNGVKLLEFNRPPRDLEFKPIGVKEFRFREKGDSVKIWFTGVDTTSQLVILSEKRIIDTISLRPKSRIPNLTSQKLEGDKKKSVSVLPQKAVPITMNLPILSWQDSLFLLTRDSLPEKLKALIEIDSLNPRTLTLKYPWREKSTYHLTIFPKGITGINGKSLKDTILRQISVTPKDQLGNILLTLNPPDSTKQYVVSLLSNKKKLESRILPPGKTKAEWKLMPPGDYSLELIEDTVPNGFWDSGNYLRAQQPERVFVKKLEKLRANWDLEIIWTPTDTPPEVEDPSNPPTDKNKKENE
ncbi:MAG TPA: hypothetical protein ENK85_00720 [Saprospiraceae bacterium]|nr:hypothetical protein [Saprospiraceae bacterium]